MTSSLVAKNFLSHIGFSHSNASDLMNKFANDMSRLMGTSNQELIENALPLDLRLRLLRAIRCFHREKWSKYLMNHTSTHQQHDAFEKLVYHLIKCHIWIVYACWTVHYIRKYLVIIDDTDHQALRLLCDKLQYLKQTIVQLNEMILVIKKHLS